MNVASHFPPINNTTNNNIISLLATKTFQHLSVHEWIQTRKDSYFLIYQNLLTDTRQQLLSNLWAHKLQNETGAWVSVESLYHRTVELYTTQQAFTEDTTWWWKLSSDNRRLWHHNQVWTLSPHSVYNSQSPMHVQDFMIARISENHVRFMSCVSETDMADFLPTIDNTIITYKGEERFQQLFVGGDWLIHCCELQCTPANTQSMWKPVCWKCGIYKKYLKYECFGDPFHWHGEILQISDFLTLRMTLYHSVHVVIA